MFSHCRDWCDLGQRCRRFRTHWRHRTVSPNPFVPLHFHSPLHRFEQVQPKLIFAVDSVSQVLSTCLRIPDSNVAPSSYNNKRHSHLPKLSALLSGLSGKIPPPKVVIASNFQPSDPQDWKSHWIKWVNFLADGKQHQLGRSDSGEIRWQRLPFDTPLWILFSSGTTGRPKSVSAFLILPYVQHNSRPIVHRAGGMLLQAKKEFVICGDLSAEDVFFYYTTT